MTLVQTLCPAFQGLYLLLIHTASLAELLLSLRRMILTAGARLRDTHLLKILSSVAAGAKAVSATRRDAVFKKIYYETIASIIQKLDKSRLKQLVEAQNPEHTGMQSQVKTVSRVAINAITVDRTVQIHSTTITRQIEIKTANVGFRQRSAGPSEISTPLI